MIYYTRQSENGMMWAGVPGSDGPDGLSPGKPRVLFRYRFAGNISSRTGDVSPDGRFLFLKAGANSPKDFFPEKL